MHSDNNNAPTGQLKEVPKYKIKVNNWLVTPEPTDNPIIDKHNKKTKNHSLLPNIKKSNSDTNDNKQYYFRKDPWLADLPEDAVSC